MSDRVFCFEVWATAVLTAVTLVVLALHASPARAAPDLSLHLKKTPKRVEVSVATKPDAVRFKVWLNGKPITNRFGTTGFGADKVSLGRHDGLRFGKNRLKAMVLRPNGRKIVRRTRFRIGRGKPLPSAGPDRVALAGDRVRLDARKTKQLSQGAGSARSRGGLRMYWKITRKPLGSKPRLRKRKTARPALIGDLTGTYELELRVKARRSTGVRIDRARVELHDPETGAAGMLLSSVPVDQNGVAAGLQLVNGQFAGTYYLDAMFFFDRQTMEPLSPTTNGPLAVQPGDRGPEQIQGAVNTALNNVPPGHDVLTLYVGQPISDNGAEWAEALNYALGSQLANVENGTGISGVGVAGSSDNPATKCEQQVASWRGCAVSVNVSDVHGNARFTGMIARGSSGNYAFVPLYEQSYGMPKVSFNSRAPNSGESFNTIRVGTDSYSTGEIPAIGGFQVAVLGGKTLDPVVPVGASAPSGNGTWFFGTNSGSPAGSTAQVNAMQDLIEAAGSDRAPAGPTSTPQDSRVIVVQGIGVPASSTTAAGYPAAWSQLGATLAGYFGATSSAFNATGSQPGAAIGPAPALSSPEADGGYALVASSLYRVVPDTYQSKTNVSNVESSHGMLPIDVATADGGTDSTFLPPAATGLLVRDTYWHFEPAGGSSDGYDTTAADPSAIMTLGGAAAHLQGGALAVNRFPNAGDPEWQAALVYAASKLQVIYDPVTACYQPPGGQSDIRSNYCGGPPPSGDWSDVIARLEGALPYPQGASFSQAVWDAMKQAVAGELQDVDTLNGAVSKMQQLYGAGSEVKALIDLQAIAADINQTVSAATTSAVQHGTGWWLGVFGDALDAIAPIVSVLGPEGEIAGTLMYLTAGGLLAATDYVHQDSGEPTLGPLLSDYTVATIGEELVNRFTTVSESFGAMRDQVATDPFKLDYFIDVLGGQDLSGTGVAESAFEASSRRFFYSLIVPAAYSATLVLPGANPTPVDIPTYECRREGHHRQIFASTPAASYYYDSMGPNTYTPYILLRPGLDPNETSNAMVPSGVLEPLFQPTFIQQDGTLVTSGQNGIGAYQPFFYNRTFNDFNSPLNPAPVNCTD